MGEEGLKTLIAHLNGSQVERRLDTGVLVATVDNMNAPEVDQLLHPPTVQHIGR